MSVLLNIKYRHCCKKEYVHQNSLWAVWMENKYCINKNFWILNADSSSLETDIKSMTTIAWPD